MTSFKRTKVDIDDFYSRFLSCTIEKVEYRGNIDSKFSDDDDDDNMYETIHSFINHIM